MVGQKSTKSTRNSDRGISPVIGVALLVFLVAIAAAGVGVMALEFSQEHLFEPASASVDIEYDEGFSMSTHSVEITAESTWQTEKIVVKTPDSNFCMGRKTLKESGDSVTYNYCSKGDTFIIVAHSESTSTLIEEYTI